MKTLVGHARCRDAWDPAYWPVFRRQSGIAPAALSRVLGVSADSAGGGLALPARRDELVVVDRLLEGALA